MRLVLVEAGFGNDDDSVAWRAAEQESDDANDDGEAARMIFAADNEPFVTFGYEIVALLDHSVLVAEGWSPFCDRRVSNSGRGRHGR